MFGGVIMIYVNCLKLAEFIFKKTPSISKTKFFYTYPSTKFFSVFEVSLPEKFSSVQNYLPF